MKCETKKYKVDTSKFTKEQLNYIDYERMEETLTKFIFPSKSDDMYEFIALFLKQQYNLEIKYLEPDIDSCSYISQKAPIFGNTKKITDANITIEPLNQNVFKQISYTPINQAFDIGTVVSLHETIPYTNPDGTTPPRGLLTSASLTCGQYTKDNFEMNNKTYKATYKNLCNRCIPYSSIDVGSEIIGKFIIKTSSLRKSMSIYKFRRPADNILEIVTPDYLNVTIDYILDLTEKQIIKTVTDSHKLEVFNKYIKLMRDSLNKKA